MTTIDDGTRDENNVGRHGKPYSLRLTEDERKALEAKRAEFARRAPYNYQNHRQHGSMGHFLVAAALAWKAPPTLDELEARNKTMFGEPGAPPPRRRAARRRPGSTGRRRAGSTGAGGRKPAKRSGRRPAKKGGRK